jgi:hypothetical protein
MSTKGEAAIGALRNYFPERASELSRRVSALNADKQVLEKWREEQLLKFIQVLKVNAEELERAHTEQKAATLAWIARNILELDVWIDYCNLSDSHAKRFMDDSVRDMVGFFATIGSLVQDSQRNDLIRATTLAQDAVGKVAQHLIGSIDEKFLRVDKAAEELGRRDIFVGFNKVYSKLAHPTAWLVSHSIQLHANEDFCDTLFADGVLMIAKALTKIYEHIVQRFPAVANVATLYGEGVELGISDD